MALAEGRDRSRFDRSTLRPTIAIAIALAAAYLVPHVLNLMTPVKVGSGVIVQVNGPMRVTVPSGWTVDREEAPPVLRLDRAGLRIDLRSPYPGRSVRDRISLYVVREFRTTLDQVIVGKPFPRGFEWADEAVEAGYRREADGRAVEGRLISANWGGGFSLIVDAWAPAGAFDAARSELEAILASIQLDEAFAP